MLQFRVTAQFYLENKRKIHPLGMKAYLPKRGEETRESPDHLAPLFICLFLPLGLPCVNWASQECCLFYLRFSLRSLDLPLTFLCSIFSGFPLACLLASAILDSCFLFYLPNTCNPEKAMATHSSTLAWKIPWTEEPSRLPSMGSQESDKT